MVITTWTTKDGREIPIQKMDDTHLVNSIKMMYRHGFAKLSTFRLFLFGSRPTAAGAQMAWAHEFTELITKRPSPLLDALQDEADRRELSVW